MADVAAKIEQLNADIASHRRMAEEYANRAEAAARCGKYDCAKKASAAADSHSATLRELNSRRMQLLQNNPSTLAMTHGLA